MSINLYCHLCPENNRPQSGDASLLMKHYYEAHDARHCCLYCHMQFLTEDDKKIHIEKVHISNAQYRCLVCVTTATKKKGLIQHQRDFHPNLKDLTCDNCKLITTKEISRIHMQYCSPSDPVARNRPSSTSSGGHQAQQAAAAPRQPPPSSMSSTLQRNPLLPLPLALIDANIAVSYVCQYCAERFKNRDDHCQHLYAEHEATIMCSFCDCQFQGDELMAQRIFKEHCDRDHKYAQHWICIYCNLSFKKREEVLAHQRGIGHRVIKCGFCPLVLPTERIKQLHEMYAHDDDVVDLSRQVRPPTLQQQNHGAPFMTQCQACGLWGVDGDPHNCRQEIAQLRKEAELRDRFRNQALMSNEDNRSRMMLELPDASAEDIKQEVETDDEVQPIVMLQTMPKNGDGLKKRLQEETLDRPRKELSSSSSSTSESESESSSDDEPSTKKMPSSPNKAIDLKRPPPARRHRITLSHQPELDSSSDSDSTSEFERFKSRRQNEMKRISTATTRKYTSSETSSSDSDDEDERPLSKRRPIQKPGPKIMKKSQPPSKQSSSSESDTSSYEEPPKKKPNTAINKIPMKPATTTTATDNGDSTKSKLTPANNFKLVNTKVLQSTPSRPNIFKAAAATTGSAPNKVNEGATTSKHQGPTNSTSLILECKFCKLTKNDRHDIIRHLQDIHHIKVDSMCEEYYHTRQSTKPNLLVEQGGNDRRVSMRSVGENCNQPCSGCKLWKKKIRILEKFVAKVDSDMKM